MEGRNGSTFIVFILLFSYFLFSFNFQIIKSLLLDLNGQGGPSRPGTGAGGLAAMGSVLLDDDTIYPGSGSQSRHGDGFSGDG